MTQAAHTPGPWVFRKDASYEGALEDNYISAEGEDIMGDPPYYPFCPHEDADWHLIASAPDLLEALIKTRDELLSLAHSEFDGVWTGADFKELTADADAAIAKAKGGEA